MLTREERDELRRKADASPAWTAETAASACWAAANVPDGLSNKIAEYIEAISPDIALSLLDSIDDAERRVLAADRAVATATQTIASLREHMASGGATARVQELTRELHEVRRQLREEKRRGRGEAPTKGPSMEFVAIDIDDGQEIVFRFTPDAEAWVFINDDTARPVLVGDLDEGSTPFFLTCPEQHEGDRFRITIVRPAK